MSLGVLVTVVALGIALIVTIVHLTGGSRRKPPPDHGEAILEFGKAFPLEAIRTAIMTEDGSATFFRLADGKTGLLQAMGRHSVARIIEPDSVSIESVEPAAGLRILFRETAFKGGTYLFSSTEQAAEVALWLAGSFARAGQDRPVPVRPVKDSPDA